ncbi:WD repeat-containing protein [Oopsacas minuta]|uniref:WD repeat-containing protein n=1 Tax=Oopsacas minuta TaxID=111878 RepID=A0AAV7K5D2_9METZ|nr:WD repeat-containing protein [Oopsacas minuta]
MCEFSDVSGEILAVEERQNNNDVIHRLDVAGDIIQSQEIIISSKSIKHTAAIYIGPVMDGRMLLVLDRGWIVVVHTSNLKCKDFELQNSVRSLLIDGGEIVFSTSNESLIWWTMDGKQVQEIKAPVEQALKMSWGAEGATIWLAGPSYLSLLQVDKDKNSCKLIGQIQGYKITCLGLSHNPDGGELVAGDITGNVAVWAETTSLTHEYKLSNPLRCIIWTKESGILIGCLDGSIYRWDSVTWNPPDRFCILQGSVLHMRLSMSADQLAVGTSKGQLGIFSLSKSEIPSPILLFYAHEQTSGEVWSVCWSPDDKRLATASEDTSVRVWEYNTTGVPLHTFLCHSAAVTAVDWKQTSRGSLLASCSDDRTVVLHCGQTYITLHTIKTAGVYGWYTLTYMCFSPLPHSHLLACVTQNGHIVFYDVTAGKQLIAIRIHLGSVEGLNWYSLSGGEGRLATLSSDCTLQYFSTDTL